jgi:hypothetical protein
MRRRLKDLQTRGDGVESGLRPADLGAMSAPLSRPSPAEFSAGSGFGGGMGPVGGGFDVGPGDM